MANPLRAISVSDPTRDTDLGANEPQLGRAARAVGRPPGRPRSRSGPSAVHTPCALVRRARRRRAAAAGRAWCAWRHYGMLRGPCAGTEASDARGRSERMHWRPDHALHTLRARASARTRQHASAVGDAHRAPFCAMKGWHGVQVPLTAARSTLTLTVILNPPSRLHPPRLTLTLGLTGPWRMPRSGHADPAGCPTLALAPGGRRPRGRGSTHHVLPRVEAARPRRARLCGV